jgi:hypothetical protein
MDLVVPYVPTRELRSEDQCLLEDKTCTNLKSYGDRSFIKAAAVLWNSLPIDLRRTTSLEIFKSHLKTYLFQQKYGGLAW